MRKKLLFTVILVCSAIFTMQAQVSTESDLQAVIDAAGSDMVTIQIGGDIEISAPILIDAAKKISIQGNGKTLSVTEAGVSAWRIFEVKDAGTTLNITNLTLKGGALGNTEAEANYGGAIYAADKASLVLEDVTISGTKAYKGGSVFVAEGNLQVKGTSTFTSNEAYSFGGAIYVESADSDVEISSSSKFETNTAGHGGGAIYLTIEKGLINIGDDSGNAFTQFTGNQTLAGNRGGGAVFITQDIPTFTTDLNVVLKANFQDNKSAIAKLCNYPAVPGPGCFDSQGGGCYMEGGQLTIKEGSVFNNNTAEGGGALYLRGIAKIDFEKNIQLTNNTAIFAGALCLYLCDETNIEEANFTGNTAIGNEQTGVGANNGNGSAIYIQESKMTMKNSLLENNITDHTVSPGYGAICSFTDCDITLEGCSFLGNKSVNGSAVVSDGKLNVVNCEFLNNVAQSLGTIYNMGDMTVSNTLIAKNEAGAAAGGIFCWNNSTEKTTVLTNVTIVDNTAVYEAGAILTPQNAKITINNSIIWRNTSGDDSNIVSKSLPVEYQNSLVEGITDDTNGNIEGILANKPLFAGEMNGYDPSIPYYSLDINSPGVNSGDKSLYTAAGATASDLSGIDRTGNTDIEMGAYESTRNLVYHSNFDTDVINVLRLAKATTSATIDTYEASSLPTRTDYSFAQWASEANGGTTYTNGQVVDITDATIYHFYAQWSKNQTPPTPPIPPVDPEKPVEPDPNPDPENPSSNAEVTDNVYIRTSTGTLHIESPKPDQVYIYTLKGQLYKQQRINEGSTVIHLPGGLYVVVLQENQKAQKILIND